MIPYPPSGPRQIADEAKFHTQDLDRALQRDQRAQAEMLSRVRRIMRRILGRPSPS